MTFFYECPECGHYMIATTLGWWCEACYHREPMGLRPSGTTGDDDDD